MIKKAIILIFVITTAILSLQFMRSPASSRIDITSFYLSGIDSLQLNLKNFLNRTQEKQPKKNLQKTFLTCRLTYKKLSVLSDYFNQFETISINSPAINRITSEVADNIIPPSGFQAIEDLLFGDWQEENFKKIETLVSDMLEVLTRLENEKDLQYKFNDELVWDALRSATVAITTNGITGLDSPIANYSLIEATASFDGILEILRFYKPIMDEKNSVAFAELAIMITKAKNYLLENNNFNKFDRLKFITNFINPFYKKLVETRIKTGISTPAGRHAINYEATSFFSANAFDINFYSPPQEYWVTKERVLLGKKLFNDAILSGDNSRSCASCHQPEKAFTDGLQKPYAIDNKTLLKRNTPTLYNSGYQTSQFYDSRADILENQLTEVVHDEKEMKGSLKKSIEEIHKSTDYVNLFRSAYQMEKQPLSNFTLANAIACYVRSLQSFNSRFDQYISGDDTRLTNAEKRGFNLFAGKAKCATCHFIPLFNGVAPPFYTTTESEVLGVPKNKNKKNAEIDDDLGKYNFIRSEIYRYSFKTPTIRNIELTAPYMHNGVFLTLEEVMKFYNNGGGRGLGIAPEFQTLPFDKLNLSKKEIKDVIAFMKTLTDTSALNK